MKNSLTAIYYSFRRKANRWSDELSLLGFVILGIACVTFGYQSYKTYASSELPNEAKYVQYEKIIKQLADGQLKDMIVPKHSSISIESDGTIVVANDISRYSVKRNLSESGLIFKRYSGSIDLLFETILVGAIVMGLIFLLVSCVLIKLLSKVLSLFVELVSSFISKYKCKKKGLNDSKKVM